MTILRFMTLTIFTTTIGFGLLASFVSNHTARSIVRRSPISSAEMPLVDLSQAETLSPGEGLAELEVQQTTWVTDLSGQIEVQVRMHWFVCSSMAKL